MIIHLFIKQRIMGIIPQITLLGIMIFVLGSELLHAEDVVLEQGFLNNQKQLGEVQVQVVPVQPAALQVTKPATVNVQQKEAVKEKDVAKDENKSKEKETKKEEIENPVSKAIKSFFKNREDGPLKPGKLLKRPKHRDNRSFKLRVSGSLDYIDNRAPHDADITDILEQAIDHIDSKNWDFAIRQLRFVLDRPLSISVSTAEGKTVPARWIANELIDRFPPDVLQRYQNLYNPSALQAWEQAMVSGYPDDIVDLATRYFHTESGYLAADYTANWHRDRQELGMALYWLNRLQKSGAPITRQAPWKMKRAQLIKQIGSKEEGEKISQEIAAVIREIPLAGLSRSPEMWLKKVRPVEPLAPAFPTDWPMLYGTPDRTGRVVGGKPLLLKRWTAPTTNNKAIHDKIEEVVIELESMSHTPAGIPTLQPIAINGKAIFRSFRGVQVLDISTGKRIWESRDRISPEQELMGQAAQNLIARGLWNERSGGAQPSSLLTRSVGTSDRNALVSLLYRDGIFGQVSSDGKRLFVIEDQIILHTGSYSSYSTNNVKVDNYWRDWSSNSLTAYNLETGRAEWMIGGRQLDELFSKPLSGHHFFGPPTPYGDELFIISEKDDAIHLQVLDAATGHPKWSTLLSYIDTPIYNDKTRRWWPASVSIQGGVIVCPTTSGWLVGVDKISHSILWTYRYVKRQNVDEERMASANPKYSYPQSLNARWSPSAPIISQNKVVFTPPESVSTSDACLVCVDLLTGDEKWRIQKPFDGIYLAGTYENQVVIVAKKKLYHYSLETGSLLKTSEFFKADLETALPSGFGFFKDGSYYLPTNQRMLLEIDLNTTKVVNRFFQHEEDVSLGNLLLYQGQLLSLSPTGLVCYEQKDRIENEIRERKLKDPNDAWALTREADIHLIRRNYDAALKLLKPLVDSNIPEDLKARYQSNLLTCLEEVIREDLSSIAHTEKEFSRTDDLNLLQQQSESQQEQLVFHQLDIDRMVHAQQYEAAYQRCRELYNTIELSQTGSDSSKLQAPLRSWLSNTIQTIYQKMPKDSQAKLDADVRHELTELEQQSIKNQQSWYDVWQFHPLADELAFKMADVHLKNEAWGEAELLLLQLGQSPRAETAATALMKTITLMSQQKLYEDAHYYIQKLRRYKPLQGKDQNTIAEFLTKWEAKYEKKRKELSNRVQDRAWKSGHLGMNRYSKGYYYYGSSSNQMKELLPNSPLDFHRNQHYVYRNNQLVISKSHTQDPYWIIPLHSTNLTLTRTPIQLFPVGHQLLVFHKSVLHMLSPLTREVLWILPLDIKVAHNRIRSSSSRKSNVQSYKLDKIVDTSSLISNNSMHNQSLKTFAKLIPVLNDSYFCVYTYRGLNVYETRTGRLLWSRKQLPYNFVAVGTTDEVMVLPSNDDDSLNGEVFRFSAKDGREIHLDKKNSNPKSVDESGENNTVYNQLAQTLAIEGRNFVTVSMEERKSFLFKHDRSLILKAGNPVTKETAWTITLTPGSRVALYQQNELLALSPSGEIQTFDLTNGESVQVGSISPELFKKVASVRLMMDKHRLYICLGSSTSSSSRYYYGYSSNRMTTQELRGTFLAIDRKSGQQLWMTNLNGRRLITNNFDEIPVLLFLSLKYVHKNNTYYYNTKLYALNKQTGKPMIDEEFATMGSFRAYAINMEEQFIDISSSRERIRLALKPGLLPLKATRPESK